MDVKVGILSEKQIEMRLCGTYCLDGTDVTGAVSLHRRNLTRPMEFVPVSPDCYAEVSDVTIGVNFHWERRETQRFIGKILILPTDDTLTLINILSVEDYLTSVISSEMSATSSIELLKAHAVISRSWLLAQIIKLDTSDEPVFEMTETDAERIRWYDRDDHTLFDVCADDHCQRYQGITRQSTPEVRKAIEATAGEVLVCDGKPCDARFSKCCGGVFEQFENCWQPSPKKYLVARADNTAPMIFPDLTIEDNAREWILSQPAAFCNTNDPGILTQVLNGYDRETADFYRWNVEYSQQELSELIKRRSGIDFGTVTDLIPIQRGTSGRIVVLRIVGTKRTMDIGKELEIRRCLSESHLYSSAFVISRTPDSGFRLDGAGWGHGVGLCQIGAAVMAAKGYSYREILLHYFPGTSIAPEYNQTTTL